MTELKKYGPRPSSFFGVSFYDIRYIKRYGKVTKYLYIKKTKGFMKTRSNDFRYVTCLTMFFSFLLITLGDK